MAQSSPMSKPCVKCGATDRSPGTGQCLPCKRVQERAARAANPDLYRERDRRRGPAQRAKHAERDAAYRETHREEAVARSAAWRAAHPGYQAPGRDTDAYREQAAAATARWKEAHPDANREWYAAHPGAHAANERRRYAADPGTRLASVHNRRALGLTAFVALVDVSAIYARDGWMCQLCGLPVDPLLSWPDPGSRSIDHIRPYAKGGTHEPANVQLAHFGCNSSKRDRWEAAPEGNPSPIAP